MLLHKAVSTMLLLSCAVMAHAVEQWQKLDSGPESAATVQIDLGSVALNGNGDRVTTVRSLTGGFRMDILTEYDCGNRRSRALSSALTDKDGRLVAANGSQQAWFDERKSLGLPQVCAASLQGK